MKKVNYSLKKNKTGKRKIGEVKRSSRSSLAYVDANGNVYEVNRNTSGRPKGSKNKKGRKK